MEVEVHNFQQHTEVRWLSIGYAVKCVLEQWDVITPTHFLEQLAKDSRKMPKSVKFKRVHTMVAIREKWVTRVSLEFLNDIVPVFKEFILLFQKECPVVHLLYDNMCSVLLKLMKRFMTEQAIGNKYVSDLTLIECTNVKLQLPEKDIVIGTDMRKALKNLAHDQQKYVMLGILSFFGTMVSCNQITIEWIAQAARMSQSTEEEWWVYSICCWETFITLTPQT